MKIVRKILFSGEPYYYTFFLVKGFIELNKLLNGEEREKFSRAETRFQPFQERESSRNIEKR